MPRVGEPLGDRDDAVVEELRLVDADDLGDAQACLLDVRRDLGGARHGGGLGLEALVADDLHVVVAVVDARLEEQDALLGEARALDPAEQLLGLAAEHRAADDLDATAALVR